MDLFPISNFLVFVMGLGFALFVYWHDRKSKVNTSWLLASSSIAFWGAALYGVVSSQNSQQALYWQYLLDFCASFIPALYLNFTLDFLRIPSKKVFYWTNGIAAVVAILSFTPWFKPGMTTSFGYNWIEPGPIYFILPLSFTLTVVLSMVLLYRAYVANKQNPGVRSQILYVLVGGALGFAGGITNFLPQLFNIYPFGNYFVILYVIFMSYSVIKHQLFDAKTITTELFAGAVVVMFLFNFLTYTDGKDALVKGLELLISAFFSLALIRSVNNEIRQKEHIEKLAKDLAITNKELASANEKLKELDIQKTEFVSLASHQLRSPLTAIKGYSSMILEGDYGKITSKVKEAISRVFESSQKLVLVIEDFLNITRIELGRIKYDMTEWSFNSLVKNVIGEQKPNIERRGLALTYEEDGPEHIVYADQGKISQVVSNLIDNAAKYTKQGSITIKVNALTNEAGKPAVRMSISDTGVGIDKKTLPHLFRKFSRAEDAQKTNLIGTGLGLYVAKQIIDAHQGRIWAESAGKGQGSTFYVELALTTGIAPVPVIPAPETTPATPELLPIPQPETRHIE
jgi:signal transduction histidine kinase